MKKLLFILLISGTANAQIKVKKADVALGYLQFQAGVAAAIKEHVLYHPNELFAQHPNLNRQWWDSRISWTNKDSIPNWKISFSDANHFFKAVEFYSNMFSIAICPWGEDWKEKTTWQKVLLVGKKLGIALFFQKLGWVLTYRGHFKNK